MTETETRLLQALSCGTEQPAESLVRCLLDDEMGSTACVRVHVCRLRAKLPEEFRIDTLRRGKRTFYVLTGVKKG